MADFTLSSTDTNIPIPAGLHFDVFGGNNVETYNISTGADAIIKGGGGIDIYALAGASSAYTVKLNGTSLQLTETASNKVVEIPMTTEGDKISFAGGNAVDLKIDTSNSVSFTLGTQILSAENASIVGLGTTDTATTKGEFSITASSIAEGNSGTTNLTTTITRTGDTTEVAFVNVSTSADTATAGSDYTEITNQTINFASGASTASFTISVLADTVGEQDETLTATLSSPSTGYSISSNAGSAILTINNDDATTGDTTTSIFTLARNTENNDLNAIEEMTLLGLSEINYDLIF